jgi:tetratricopeptide (TPR) repeat protein
MEITRIDYLRRRLDADPSSIAFAQLGEEYRRVGQHQASIDVCRAGLALHPGYLSARVTLGRALLEMGELDAAEDELDRVLGIAPANLTALRALAEVHRKRGDLVPALAKYQAALALASNDPDLEQAVADLEGRLGAIAGRSNPALALAPREAVSSNAERNRALQTIAALDRWLSAIHVARAHLRA